MSIKLKLRAGTLAVVMALVAATLALQLGSAQAQTLSVEGITDSSSGTTLDGVAEGSATVTDPVAAAPSGGNDATLATLDSNTIVTENVASSDGAFLLDGAVDSTTEADIPVAPIEGTATVDGNAAVGDLVGQDLCVNVGFNADAAGCATPAPAPTDPIDGLPVVGTDVVGSVTVNEPIVPVEGGTDLVADVVVDPIADAGICFGLGINQATGECNMAAPVISDPVLTDPVVDGDIDGTVGVDAPIVPVQSGTEIDAGAAVAPLAEVDACLGLGINQATGECNTTVPVVNDPALANPVVDADVDGTVGVTAPAVPAQSGIGVDSGVVVDPLAEAGICLNVGINQDPGTCDEAIGGGGTAPPPALTPIDGDVVGEVEVGAPIAPINGGATVDTGVVVEELADVGICLNVGVNQQAGNCEDDAPANPGGGNDPGDGPGDPGDTPGEGPGGGPGDGNGTGDGDTGIPPTVMFPGDGSSDGEGPGGSGVPLPGVTSAPTASIGSPAPVTEIATIAAPPSLIGSPASVRTAGTSGFDTGSPGSEAGTPAGSASGAGESAAATGTASADGTSSAGSGAAPRALPDTGGMESWPLAGGTILILLGAILVALGARRRPHPRR